MQKKIVKKTLSCLFLGFYGFLRLKGYCKYTMEPGNFKIRTEEMHGQYCDCCPISSKKTEISGT